jgi:ubiquinone/menaquinone biosynthesis C-methylase UbiE
VSINHEVIRYYSQLSSEYDRRRFGGRKANLIGALELEWLVKNLKARQGLLHGMLLDVGCGTGRISKALLKSEYSVVSVDVNASMLSEFRLKLGGLRHKANLIRCDGNCLPLRDGVFGAVASLRVIWHMTQPERAFRELIRVARLDGLILFDLPNAMGAWRFWSWISGAKYEVLTLFFLPREIRKWCTRCEEFSLRVQYVGHVSPVLFFLPRAGLTPRAEQALVWLERAGKLPILRAAYVFLLVAITKSAMPD